MQRILVIDDDVIVLMAISAMLNKSGFEVVTATNGNDAAGLLLTSQFDLLITDLVLPNINGLELLSSLRKDENNRNLGIIVISSIDDKDIIDDAFRLGADDFIQKPILSGDLISRVEKLMAYKQSKTPFIIKKDQIDG
jgi:PleD family two-component response regulator